MASEYELKRLENIRRNEEQLALLNLPHLAATTIKLPPKKKPKRKSVDSANTREKKPKILRRSTRISGIPSNELVSLNENSLASRIDTSLGSQIEPSRTSGDISFADCLLNDTETFDAKEFTGLIKALTPPEASLLSQPPLAIKTLAKLKITHAPIKVTKKRITSLACHPSSTSARGLVCASDTIGEIGCLVTGTDVKRAAKTEDEEDEEEEAGRLFRFRPHQAQASCLKFNSSGLLLSSSYDGSVRSLDLSAEAFTEVFVDPDERGQTWLAVYNETSIMSCDNKGKVNHIDLRSNSRSSRPTYTRQLHDKKISALDVHPDGVTLATASNDGTVAIWDIRKLSGSTSKPKALQSFSFSRAVSGSFFSPDGKNLLCTSYDDTIRILTVSSEGKEITSPKLWPQKY